uniref:Rho termination factor N-terminal domain-containing protein n=1 Tax=viral metagenome TaxID=1070528 RepID=A0A6C0D8I7_9ZZZZ
MALTDILTIPFLMCLGITLVLIGVLGYLFMQRIQEQNHKISSMFELVNTMVEEMNFLKGRLQIMSYNTGPSYSQNIQQSGTGAGIGGAENNLSQKLIEVSDDENDTDEDEDDEDDENDEDDSNSDEDSDDSEDSDSNGDNDDKDKRKIEIFESESQNVKIINFDEILEESKNDNESDFSELDDADDIDSDDTDNSDSENDNEESEENGETVKIIDMSETINLDNNDIFELSKKMEIHSSETDFLKTKTIDLSDISNNLEDSNNVIDYKKMSLNKLKEIAISKGLIAENSKATKNAILKILNHE